MKIILLRHEERENNVGFNSNLNENGILKTFELSKKLSKLNKQYNIKYIYSSPFIRTLQTIYPYSQEHKKKVKIEYGLYEYLHNPYFLITKWKNYIDDIHDKDLKSIINKKYVSKVNINDLNVLENEDNLIKRISIFFDYLIKKHNKKSNNYALLLVSHKGVINKIKDIYFKKTNMDDDFQMGHIEIYDL
jgi:broad specificity phosphatase PhoE